MSAFQKTRSSNDSVAKEVRRRWKRGVLGAGVILSGAFVALWSTAGSIASPSRRAIQDYHRAYFDESATHGVVIRRESFGSMGTPVLLVRADGLAGPGRRGAALRKQLTSEGFALPKFGVSHHLLVLLHGRNGRKEDLLPVAERFCALGFLCVIPDLPAHGENAIVTVGFGAFQNEAELAGAIASEARSVLGFDQGRDFLWGMSMGGSFAIHAAALETDRWERMVIVASFDRLSGVISDSLGGLQGGLQGPLAALIKHRGGADIDEVNPIEKASQIRIPTLVIHGEDDELISLCRGRALYEAFAGTKKFVEVPGGNHDNVLITEAPVYAEMARWFLSSKKAPLLRKRGSARR